jgi:hypothetical protein
LQVLPNSSDAEPPHRPLAALRYAPGRRALPGGSPVKQLLVLAHVGVAITRYRYRGGKICNPYLRFNRA